MPSLIGIDIGGTTIKFGQFKLTGALIKKWDIPTRKEFDGMFILNDIEASLSVEVNLMDVKGIGFGVPGPVNGTVVLEAVNLGWKHMDIAEVFTQKFPHIPITVDNDANVAALGEALSREDAFPSMVLFTLGTGVGGGIIVDGKIVEGSHGAGGELGHMIIDPGGAVCNCGQKGCLETIASATGVLRIAHEKGLDAVDAKDVFDQAQAGNVLALNAVAEMTQALAIAMQHVAVTVDPDAFVFGGGVSKAGDFLIDLIKEKYQKIAFSDTKYVALETAILGHNAGIYGAFQAIKQKVMI
jgi:glucokinase